MKIAPLFLLSLAMQNAMADDDLAARWAASISACHVAADAADAPHIKAMAEAIRRNDRETALREALIVIDAAVAACLTASEPVFRAPGRQ